MELSLPSPWDTDSRHWIRTDLVVWSRSSLMCPDMQLLQEKMYLNTYITQRMQKHPQVVLHPWEAGGVFPWEKNKQTKNPDPRNSMLTKENLVK